LFHGRICCLTHVVHDFPRGLLHQWHPDSCRDQHYTQRRRSDYERAISPGASVSTPPVVLSIESDVRFFRGEHPTWSGPVHLSSEGEIFRPGGDRGKYRTENGDLFLEWEGWTTERLKWIEDEFLYRSMDESFTLREIRARS